MKDGDQVQTPLGPAQILRVHRERDWGGRGKPVRNESYAVVELANGNRRIYWMRELSELPGEAATSGRPAGPEE